MDIKFLNFQEAVLVEFDNLILPKPKDVVCEYAENYDIPDFNKYGRRFTCTFSNSQIVNIYFTSLLKEKIFPEIFSKKNPKVIVEYPFDLDFMKRNTTVAVTLQKDEPGWQQYKHIDNRSYVMAGIFHLQDSKDGGTKIYGREGYENESNAFYQSPSKKNSGVVWLNNINSWHSIGPCPEERFFYLLHVRWALF